VSPMFRSVAIDERLLRVEERAAVRHLVPRQDLPRGGGVCTDALTPCRARIATP
jgi:hypothetical protein